MDPEFKLSPHGSLLTLTTVCFLKPVSSTEFVVDEACLLELFKSCQQCGRQCRVTKRIHGLKIVVSQRCCFCDHRFGWTNLPDVFSDEEDEVVIKRWTLENGTASWLKRQTVAVTLFSTFNLLGATSKFTLFCRNLPHFLTAWRIWLAQLDQVYSGVSKYAHVLPQSKNTRCKKCIYLIFQIKFKTPKMCFVFYQILISLIHI